MSDEVEYFYIVTKLRAYYGGEDTDTFDVVLDKVAHPSYPGRHVDLDDSNYEEKVDIIRKRYLEVYTKPITVYEDQKFNKPLCEAKYKPLVQNLASKNGKKWEDIVKIVKMEERTKGDEHAELLCYSRPRWP